MHDKEINTNNNTNILPLISFIIPTFNAEKYLKQCLQSIRNQNYPQAKIEIIIADGLSDDNTTKIAQEFKSIIIENTARNADNGKYLAIKKAKGEYLVFLDSDNIIVGNFWLSNNMEILYRDKSILGAESNYLIANDFSSLNTYANLLVIADPLARCLTNNPSKIEKISNNTIRYDLKYFNKRHLPVAGANGFIWQANSITGYMDEVHKKFAETSVLAQIAIDQDIKYINIPNQGVYHYYCNNLSDYLKKRVKIGNKYLERRARQTTWVENSSKLKFVLASIYLVSIIGPTVEAFFMIAKSKRIEWIWHPLISFLTIIIYFKLFITRFFI